MKKLPLFFFLLSWLFLPSGAQAVRSSISLLYIDISTVCRQAQSPQSVGTTQSVDYFDNRGVRIVATAASTLQRDKKAALGVKVGWISSSGYAALPAASGCSKSKTNFLSYSLRKRNPNFPGQLAGPVSSHQPKIMKKALITGASQGIGLAMAHEMANAGYQLTLVARSTEKLQRAIQQLSGDGHQHLVADLTAVSSLAALIDHLEQQSYQVLINNAGYGLYGRFSEIPLEQQQHMIRLNVEAVVRLCYAYLQRARAGDAVLNIASNLGHSSFPGAAAYAGTKGFLIRFSESLWYEYKEQDIFVAAFCPGPTDTAFHARAGRPQHTIPKAITQTPEAVAKEMMHFLNSRKKPQGLPGAHNRVMYFLQRFLGRKTTVNLMGSASRSSAILTAEGG